MAGERPGHILQPTALVNEAYLRLVDWKDVRWQNRAHFFGMAAQIMRRVLVDWRAPAVAPNAGAARCTSRCPRREQQPAMTGSTWWRWTMR